MQTPHNKLLKFMQDNIETAKRMMREAESLLNDLDLSEEERKTVNKLQNEIKTGKISTKEAIRRAKELINDAD